MIYEFLQPWSTFVLKTKLSPPILEKMIRITDEIVENREGKGDDIGAGQMEDQFKIDFKILEREEVMKFFLDVCKDYVIQAFCQSRPFDKEEIIKEEWMTRMSMMWINSQKDNEYLPIHHHTNCSLSTVMYLKIPEYLPTRKSYNNTEDDGAIIFINNPTQDKIWGMSDFQVRPQVGDFFIFPASQKHLVYPFRTVDGKGERRSVSFNASFTSKSMQEAEKKKQQEAI